MKKLWEILVPLAANDGYPFNISHHKKWDQQVKKIAGGLTIFPPTLRGIWAHVGQEFVDRMIPVRIYCTEEQINKVAQITLSHYSQRAVMYYVISNDVKIVQSTDNGANK